MAVSHLQRSASDVGNPSNNAGLAFEVMRVLTPVWALEHAKLGTDQWPYTGAWAPSNLNIHCGIYSKFVWMACFVMPFVQTRALLLRR